MAGTASIGFKANQIQNNVDEVAPPGAPHVIAHLLQAPGLEHADFFDALKNAGATRIMPSHWVLESDRTAVDLLDHFVALLTPNDQLLVAELGQEVVWGTKD